MRSCLPLSQWMNLHTARSSAVKNEVEGKQDKREEGRGGEGLYWGQLEIFCVGVWDIHILALFSTRLPPSFGHRCSSLDQTAFRQLLTTKTKSALLHYCALNRTLNSSFEMARKCTNWISSMHLSICHELPCDRGGGDLEPEPLIASKYFFCTGEI